MLAHWAAYFGEPETALELIRSIPVAENSTTLSFMMWRPVVQEVRRFPGFNDLVREMGYLDYWAEYGWPDFCEPVGDNEIVCS